MSLNLLRNVKLFLTTNVDPTTKNTRTGKEAWSFTKAISTAAYDSANGYITITCSGHGLPNHTTATGASIAGVMQVVVSGVTGTDAAWFNGTFTLTSTYYVSATQFRVTKAAGGGVKSATFTSAVLTSKYFHNAEASSYSGLTSELLLSGDGFKFNRSTTVETVSPNESGDKPIRGERQFNTGVSPVEFSFSTHIRPYNTGTSVTADEGVLWNSLLGIETAGVKIMNAGVGGVTTFSVSSEGILTLVAGASFYQTGLVVGNVYSVTGVSTGDSLKDREWNAPAVLTAKNDGTYTYTLKYLSKPTSTAGSIAGGTLATLNIDLVAGSWVTNPTLAYAHSGASDVLKAVSTGLIACMDNITYLFDDCVIDSADISFSLDQVATVTWTGKARNVRQYSKEAISEATGDYSFDGATFLGAVKRANKLANYITTRASTVLLKSNIDGIGGNSYYAPITGGSIRISNNIQSVTSNNLYEVNYPIAFFQGNRTITGSIQCYLRNGLVANDVQGRKHIAEIWTDMVDTNGNLLVDPKHYLELQIGGSSASTRVHFDLRAVSLQVPEITTDSNILSTNINFRAQGSASNGSDYDITNANELFIRYYA